MTEATFVQIRKFRNFTHGGGGSPPKSTKNPYSGTYHFEGLGWARKKINSQNNVVYCPDQNG